MKKLFLGFIFSFIVLCFSCNAFAVTFGWDANTDHVVGYKLYSGPDSGIYTDLIDVGDVLQYTTTSPLQPRYYALTAYNESSESGYSIEVLYIPDSELPPPVGAPHKPNLRIIVDIITNP